MSLFKSESKPEPVEGSTIFTVHYKKGSAEGVVGNIEGDTLSVVDGNYIIHLGGDVIYDVPKTEVTRIQQKRKR